MNVQKSTIVYILFALAIVGGLYFQQRNYNHKFCEVVKQQRETERDSLLDRATQAKLFADKAITDPVKNFHIKLYEKIEYKLAKDPDLQMPFDCEVNTR